MYLVKRLTKCKVCDGEGVIMHPFWLAYERDGEPKGVSAEDYARLVYGLDAPPPIGEDCHECGGTGEVEEWVSLEVALKELGVMR